MWSCTGAEQTRFSCVVTDGVWRGTKVVSLKQIADGAMHMCEEQ